MATNNSWNSQDPAQVALGGTGDSSLTAYAVLCGGTTSTGPVQSISSVGTSGQILTSSGAAALPTFTSASAVGSMVLLQTLTASNSASLVFTDTYITTSYAYYFIQINEIFPVSNGVQLVLNLSTNNGSTYVSTGFAASLLSNPYNSATLTNTNSTANMPLSLAAGLSSTIGISGYLNLYGLAVSSTGVFVPGQLYSGTTNYIVGGAYIPIIATTVNALQFIMSSGNIASGTISLYGITQ